MTSAWNLGRGWDEAIDPRAIDRVVSTLGDYVPPAHQLLRAFSIPIDQIRVLIVGQDPYPTPGDANGLAFSVDASSSKWPPTLRNIFAEYVSDTGYPMPVSGDLSSWHKAGVLLLNRVLTVAPGEAGSHRAKGWEQITDSAIKHLQERNPKLVSILWGKDAQGLAPYLKATIISPHPSPLSAYRGFFGSRPFTRANEMLKERGATPINWRLP